MLLLWPPDTRKSAARFLQQYHTRLTSSVEEEDWRGWTEERRRDEGRLVPEWLEDTGVELWVQRGKDPAPLLYIRVS